MVADGLASTWTTCFHLQHADDFSDILFIYQINITNAHILTFEFIAGILFL